MIVRLQPKGLRTAQPGTVARLKALRRELEAGAGKVTEIELPAVLLLADVCEALGLTPGERREVLGAEAERRFVALCGAPVRPRTSNSAHVRDGR